MCGRFSHFLRCCGLFFLVFLFFFQKKSSFFFLDPYPFFLGTYHSKTLLAGSATRRSFRKGGAKRKKKEEQRNLSASSRMEKSEREICFFRRRKYLRTNVQTGNTSRPKQTHTHNCSQKGQFSFIDSCAIGTLHIRHVLLLALCCQLDRCLLLVGHVRRARWRR